MNQEALSVASAFPVRPPRISNRPCNALWHNGLQNAAFCTATDGILQRKMPHFAEQNTAF